MQQIFKKKVSINIDTSRHLTAVVSLAVNSHNFKIATCNKHPLC